MDKAIDKAIERAIRHAQDLPTTVHRSPFTVHLSAPEHRRRTVWLLKILAGPNSAPLRDPQKSFPTGKPDRGLRVP